MLHTFGCSARRGGTDWSKSLQFDMFLSNYRGMSFLRTGRWFVALSGPYFYGHLTIVRRQIVDCLKLRGFADNNFRRGWNEAIQWKDKALKKKGETSRTEQFLVFPQCLTQIISVRKIPSLVKKKKCQSLVLWDIEISLYIIMFR